jgi:chromosome segregation ATPase
MSAEQPAPKMTLQLDGIQRTLTDESLYAESVDSQSRRPKSPGGLGIGSFFGWNATGKSASDSPTTTFSERSLSPIPSPGLGISRPSVDANGRPRLTPPGLDVHKANMASAYFHNPETPLLLGSGTNNVHVRELERELSHVSQELAESIRREMELEDEMDRLRADLPPIPSSDINQRRTSDYFSDSGASSTRFPVSDFDAKLEQMERQLRKVEQEKANLHVETAARLQTELSRRRDLEELVRDLEDQLDKRDEEETPAEKLDELTTSLEETKRRLGQEKMTKENFEDLYSATREELEKLRNEADNLRDEVVPQLKARVEGLESQASDTQALVYENTRMQQELAALRGAMDGNHSRFNSIAEDGVASAIGHRMSLQRSGTGSMTRSTSLRRGGSIKDSREGGRQRAGSIVPVGPIIPEAVKEIEDQRDALHKALKLLIKRHERAHRDHERAVKKLTNAKNKAESVTPKRTAYTKEVAFLKEEVTTLRKRTEDALEAKWQYEKSLSGLKMDLDRAEQETRGLRVILQGADMSGSNSADADAEDEQLKISITRAETERDHARQIAEEYRQRAQSATDGSSEELMNSAKRMDELAEQLEAQVQSHTGLRNRLSAAIAKGEREQRESTRQIEEMQKRLAGMEDSVLAAQQHSETTLANHDAEVRRIEDATSPQLSRLRISIPEPSKLGPPSPMTKKSPKLSGKLSETSLLEMSRTQMLERKVKELEALLREAEEDVQTVVQRVNRSQLEVAELQTERDVALNQMRKLQALVEKEREKADALMQ